MIRPSNQDIKKGVQEAKRLARNASQKEKQQRQTLEDWLDERQGYTPGSLFDAPSKQVQRRLKKYRAKRHLQWLREFDGLTGSEFQYQVPHFKEHAVTCGTDQLFKVNPKEQQALTYQSKVDKTELFWMYRELEDEEKTMCYDSENSEQSKDPSQMYRDHMLARSEPSDDDLEW